MRGAEEARTNLDVLTTAIQMRLTRAVVENADEISELATTLIEVIPRAAEIAGAAFEFIGGRLERISDLASAISSGDVGGALEALARPYRELFRDFTGVEAEDPFAARERLGLRATPGVPAAPRQDPLLDPALAQERAERLLAIEERLQKELFNVSHQGAERVRAEHRRLVEEIEGLATIDPERAETLIAQAEAVRDARLARLAEKATGGGAGGQAVHLEAPGSGNWAAVVKRD